MGAESARAGLRLTTEGTEGHRGKSKPTLSHKTRGNLSASLALTAVLVRLISQYDIICTDYRGTIECPA